MHLRTRAPRHFRLVTLMICVTVAGAFAADPPTAEEHVVDAGSYNLFFRVIRGTGPTILLEAGGGDDSSMWNDFAPRLAMATGATVVAYDRPGFGQSDLPDIPCDMREESSSLWRALKLLGLDQNVVLVGLSYGGWMVRLHANDHPDQVAAVVFVDPFNTPFVDSMGVAYWDQHPMMGNLPFDTSQPEKLTRGQRALVRMVGDGLGPKVDLMRTTTIKAGTPVRLLSSRVPFLPEEAEQEAWWRSHEQVVAAIPGAVLVEAKASSHYIPVDQPELVLEQIGIVLAEIH